MLVIAICALSGCQAPLRPQPLPEPLPAPTPDPQPSAVSPQPHAPAQPEPARTPPDLFERLRAQLGTDHCESSSEQQRWVQLYAPRPKSFGARIEPMLPLLDYVLRQVEAAGLPGEFALIPIIESSYRPQARARSGPTGLWQFTAGTARAFGLEVAAGHDERLSVVDATEAALSLLGGLQQTHGDWVLAAAGFNAGEFRVRKLLETGPAPEPGTLPQGLARVTYEYVQKLKAWACMLSEPDRFGIELPDPQAFTPLARVSPPRTLQRLPLISDASGLSAERVRSLNPLLRPQPPSRGDSELLLPEDAAAELMEFVERVNRGEVALPEPRFHSIVAGDTLSAIAGRYGIELRELMRLNGLRSSSILRIGQQLRLEP